MDTDIFSTADHDREIYTVTHLNRLSRQLLETHLPLVWVEGEISNMARPSSGHWYFTLKDERAQVRCAMFRGRNRAVPFAPDHGQQVLIRARVSIYEGRGDYQLIAEHMQPAGQGALQQAFERLKQTLSAQGLFDGAHKCPLPEHPRHIGVITSPTGAAVRDVLSVLRRRYPALPVTVIPVPVQGEQAAPAIIEALALAQRSGLFDLLILTRGGGSIEDLWAFNSEALARAIYQCPIPLISAVGHEVDFTIADFTADVRAPTPSAAAEMAVPDVRVHLASLQEREVALARSVLRRIEQTQSHLQSLGKRLRHPGEKLRHQSQRLDHLEMRLTRRVELELERQRARLSQLASRLRHCHPHNRLQPLQRQLTSARGHLQRQMQRQLHETALRIGEKARVLDSVSPLATLERGFAALTTEHGKLVRRAREVAPGDRLSARVSEGRIDCQVIASGD